MDSTEKERLIAGLATLKEKRKEFPRSICLVNGIYSIEKRLGLKPTVEPAEAWK